MMIIFMHALYYIKVLGVRCHEIKTVRAKVKPQSSMQVYGTYSILEIVQFLYMHIVTLFTQIDRAIHIFHNTMHVHVYVFNSL